MKKKKILYTVFAILLIILFGLGSVFLINNFSHKNMIKKDLENEKLYNQYVNEWNEASSAVFENYFTSSHGYSKERNELVNRVAKEFGYDKQINSVETSNEFIKNYLSQKNKQPIGENDEIVFNRITIILKEYFKNLPSAKVKDKTFWYSPDYATVIYAENSANSKTLNEKLPENIKNNIKNNSNTWISLPDGKIAQKEQVINVTLVGEGEYSFIGDKFKGHRVTLQTTPKDGYEIEGIFTKDEKELTKEQDYAFIVEGDMDIVIKFKTAMCTISAEYGGGYVKGTGTYNFDEEVKLEAVPAEGYIFDGFYLDNELITEELTYTFKATGNQNYVAKFTKIEK